MNAGKETDVQVCADLADKIEAQAGEIGVAAFREYKPDFLLDRAKSGHLVILRVTTLVVVPIGTRIVI